MSTLIDELRKPLYAALSDADAAAELNAVNQTEIVSCFGSFRTLANLLSERQYNALAAAIDAAAPHSRLVADMVKMLSLPGDEQGNGGGIDFGAEPTRACLDSLLLGIQQALGGDTAEAEAAAICATVKAYAERPASTAGLLGLEHVGEGDVARIRAAIAAGG